MSDSVATQLREFANKGEPVTLPASKVTVQFKRVNLSSLVARGILPATLLAQALSGFPELEKIGEKDSNPEKLAQALLDAREFEMAILTDGLVSPRIVENPNEDNDEIAYDDLDEEDRSALMGIAQLPVKRWETFLREKGADLLALDDLKRLEPEAE